MCVIAERFIKALNNKMYKDMTSVVYIDKLDIVNKYNNTYSNTIKMNFVNVKSNTYYKTKIFGGRVKVELDLSNYATQADLQYTADVDTSKFAKKVHLASLKSNVDKLDTG